MAQLSAGCPTIANPQLTPGLHNRKHISGHSMSPCNIVTNQHGLLHDQVITDVIMLARSEWCSIVTMSGAQRKYVTAWSAPQHLKPELLLSCPRHAFTNNALHALNILELIAGEVLQVSPTLLQNYIFYPLMRGRWQQSLLYQSPLIQQSTGDKRVIQFLVPATLATD